MFISTPSSAFFVVKKFNLCCVLEYMLKMIFDKKVYMIKNCHKYESYYIFAEMNFS